MTTVYDTILTHCEHQNKMLAVLLDPDKPWAATAEQLQEADFIFLGGSTGKITDEHIQKVRNLAHCPLVLFPGNADQFNAGADALLMLSLLNSTDSQWLIGQHIRAAHAIQDSGIEVIPMGYILVDGGSASSVARISHARPVAQHQIETVVNMAIAAELIGKKTVYLEAGSGASTPVSPAIIRAVRQAIHIPLIVGGGICTTEALRQAYDAGADLVVIGNFFEQHSELIPSFCHVRG